MDYTEKVTPIEYESEINKDGVVTPKTPKQPIELPSFLPNVEIFRSGNGDKSINIDSQGLWIGNKNFIGAPFKVDMDGRLTSTDINALLATIATLEERIWALENP